MLRTEKKKKEGFAKSNNENLANQFLLLNACRLNAFDLIKEAQILYKYRCYQRSFTLAFTANEEINKGQIVADYISRVTSKDELLKAFRSHDIKAAYGKFKIEIGDTYKTGKKFVHDGNELEIFVQDNTLLYDIKDSKDMFIARNRSLYVDYKDDYIPITPKDNFKAKEAKGIIKTVKEKLNLIFFYRRVKWTNWN